MFHYKQALLVTTVLGAALLSGSAFASSSTPDGLCKLECKFFGGGSDKASWVQHCHAEGTFHKVGAENLSIQDDENHLKVVCDDGDISDDHEGRTIFDGKMKIKFEDEFASFTGLREHDQDNDNSCIPPRILVRLDNDEQNRDEDNRLASEMTYTDRGFSYDIPGRCRIIKPVTLK